MKKLTAVLIILAFSLNTAVASPMGQGGGSGDDPEDASISTLILVVVVVGVAGLLVSDIIADNSEDSQDALSGVVTEPETSQETGVDWGSIVQESDAPFVPKLAISVFNIENGRNLAGYFSALLQQDEELNYSIQGTPIALGAMSSAQAAQTGLSFVDCDWFVTGDSTGVQLFSKVQTSPIWHFYSDIPDSAAVRAAAESFREFADSELKEQN